VHFVDGKPVPYNDFDLYIITERKLSDEKLDEISMNASRAIGMGGLEVARYPGEGYDSNRFFHVDVRCIPYNKLGKLMKIRRYYELKYGSQVIYGKDVFDRMNVIRQEDLSNSDGLRNLFNSLHQMLLGLNEDYNEEKRKVRIFWSYKCYMSICEALLMFSKKFRATSRERSELFGEIYHREFPELFDKIPDLVDKVQRATDFKLKLDFEDDHEELWNEALKDLLIVFEYYVKKMTGNGNVGSSINEKLPYTYFKPFLEEKIGFNFFPAQYVLNLGYLNVLKNEGEFYFSPLFTWKDVGLRMILPIYYLLKFKADGNKFWFDRAYGELKKFIRVERKGFWYLVERSLKAYGLYYEQRLL